MWHETKGGMKQIIVNYFTNLFHSRGLGAVDDVFHWVKPKVMVAMNQDLLLLFTNEEIKDTLFQMHPTKAPRPNGMSQSFYQKHWAVVGQDVCDGVRHVLNSG